MKQLNEEIQRRYKDRRQNATSTWASLIIKIAILAMVIWLVTSYKSENGKYLKKFLYNQQTTQQPKESQ